MRCIKFANGFQDGRILLYYNFCCGCTS